ncbi:MAG: cation diffusion facilitator family transporter [Xanthobacteraceae bacterium]
MPIGASIEVFAGDAVVVDVLERFRVSGIAHVEGDIVIAPRRRGMFTDWNGTVVGSHWPRRSRHPALTDCGAANAYSASRTASAHRAWEPAWQTRVVPYDSVSRKFQMAAASSSKKVVYAALVGNLLIAITKLIAAAWSGSSAMFSEGVHSLVDTGNEVLLLYGMHRASRPADDEHPLGYGRELYFWSFIVAVLIFAVGAGVSAYEGISHILSPSPIADARVNYIVLGLAFVFESGSWYIALREFRRANPGAGYLKAATRSKDPPSFIVLFEDTAALLGIMMAFAGTFAAEYFEQPVLDGVASVGIALLLAAIAIFLAIESKGLLIGEPARKATRDAILRIVRSHPGVEAVNDMITVHLSPAQILVALNVDFADARDSTDVETDVMALEAEIKKRHPEVIALFVKPQTAAYKRRADGAPEAGGRLMSGGAAGHATQRG